MNNFIYVFDKKHRNFLVKRGFQIVREDEKNSIWVFQNMEDSKINFELLGFPVVLSNTLSFML